MKKFFAVKKRNPTLLRRINEKKIPTNSHHRICFSTNKTLLLPMSKNFIRTVKNTHTHKTNENPLIKHNFLSTVMCTRTKMRMILNPKVENRT